MELRDFIFGQTGQYKNGVFDEAHKDHVIRSKGCGSLLDQIGQQSMFRSGMLCDLAEDEFNQNQEKFIREMVENAQGMDLEDCSVAVLSSFREAIEARNPS